MKFKRYIKDENGNEVLRLKPIEWKVYRYLEEQAEKDPTRWITKRELMIAFPELESGKTNHDECAALNSTRLWLLEALKRDMISHIVVLKNNCFKLAARDDQEYAEQKELNKALNHFKRYWAMKKVIKLDGQGRIIDKNGKVIDDKSLAKRLNDCLF